MEYPVDDYGRSGDRSDAYTLGRITGLDGLFIYLKFFGWRIQISWKIGESGGASEPKGQRLFGGQRNRVYTESLNPIPKIELNIEYS